MLVLEYEHERLAGDVFPELMRLAAHGLIRLVDMLVVRKPGVDGSLEIVDSWTTAGGDGEPAGEQVAALIGLRSASEHMRARDAIDGLAGDGDDDATWDIAERIPPDGQAAVILLEHLWAIPLRDAVARNGTVVLADEWVHPADLLAMGPAPAPVRRPVASRR